MSQNNLTKFELNREGVKELLRSQGMQDMVVSVANDRCPTGCVVSGYVGKTRVNARITADTKEAYFDNLENNTLLKAIGGDVK